MRLVLDTNTAISGLLWHGTPGKLIDAAKIKTVSLFTRAPLLAELRGVLLRDKFSKQLKTKSLMPDEIADGYAALASIVTPAVIAPTIAQGHRCRSADTACSVLSDAHRAPARRTEGADH